MRSASALLAILVSIFGMAQLLVGRGDFFAITTLLYTVALIASATNVLRGGRLIYLATSWGLYLGMTLAAYADVVYASTQSRDPISIFIGSALTLLPIIATIGLLLTLFAQRKEQSS